MSRTPKHDPAQPGAPPELPPTRPHDPIEPDPAHPNPAPPVPGPEWPSSASPANTENVKEWRTDVVSAVAGEVGLEKVMFEAADPEVFAWYVRDYGPEVNLFVDHSQVVQLEALRSGLWGTKSMWGRVMTYKG